MQTGEDVFGFGDSFVNGNNNRDGARLFVPRRHRGGSKCVTYLR